MPRRLGRLVAALAVLRAVLDAIGWFELQRLRSARRRLLVAGRRSRSLGTSVLEEPGPDGRGSRLTTWIPLSLAAGATGLYAIGSVRTAGRLQASDLSISDTFGLAPLESHLTNGLAVVLSGTALIVLLIGIPFVIIRIASETWSAEERQRARGTRPRWRLWLELLPYALVLVLVVVAAPWWMLPTLVLVWGGEILGVELVRRGPPTWRAHPVRTRVAVFLVTFAAYAFASGYWLAQPLPIARLALTGSGTASGVLVTDANGEFILANADQGFLYRAWPHEQVRTAVVAEPPKRSDEPSIPELLGIDIGLPSSGGSKQRSQD